MSRLKTIVAVRSHSMEMSPSVMPVELNEEMEELMLKLHEVEGVKFGDFKLKSGIQSPAYFDLRVIVSYPDLMPKVAEYLWQCAEKASEKFSSLCGVPYTALPIATVMSVEHNVPMLIRRREAKDYGTKKMIEGHYKPGDVCLVVEDVVTSGSSVYETVKTLNEYGIKVHDAVVLLNREQGGTEQLKREGINLHSVFTMTQLITTLYKHGRVDEAMHKKVLQFLEDNKHDPGRPLLSQAGGDGLVAKKKKPEMTYQERASHCSHALSKQLFNLMHEKQTNLALSVDLTKAEEILQLAEKVGGKICVLKTHVDILEDFSPNFVQKLQALSEKHRFILFEDRKFADIGNTVKLQYGGGVYKMADWAHLVNAHSVPGAGVVEGLKQVGSEKGRGCLLIAEMSSSGNLAKGDYVKATVKMAEENSDFVVGFISQGRVCDDPRFIHMSPGVKLETGTDALGQQYITPLTAICGNKSDILIVGRGITSAADPVAEAESYRQAGYKAYMERIS